jgi:hypothetical protein
VTTTTQDCSAPAVRCERCGRPRRTTERPFLRWCSECRLEVKRERELARYHRNKIASLPPGTAGDAVEPVGLHSAARQNAMRQLACLGCSPEEIALIVDAEKEPLPASDPTDLAPGTRGRLEVMRGRVSRGEAVFSPQDADAGDWPVGAEMTKAQ